MGNVTVIRAMAVYDGKLWVGGNYGELWSFDGTDWALERSGEWVWISDLYVWDGKLWATFNWMAPSGGTVEYWDGATWTVDWTVDYPRCPSFLMAYAGDLYCVLDSPVVYVRGVGGWSESFDAGGGTASTMAVYDSRLWVARGPDSKVWAFDGVDWTEEYQGTAGSAWYVAAYGGELWVGLNGTRQVFRYDGVDWVEQGFSDFRRIRCLYAAAGYLWIGTGWYARVYAWDGDDYVLDFQPPECKRDDDTYRICEYDGDIWIGTNRDGRLYRRVLGE